MTSDERAWDRGWDEHARAQRLRIAALPLWVKIQWLEDAQRMMQHLSKRQGGSSGSPPERAGS